MFFNGEKNKYICLYLIFNILFFQIANPSMALSIAASVRALELQTDRIAGLAQSRGWQADPQPLNNYAKNMRSRKNIKEYKKLWKIIIPQPQEGKKRKLKTLCFLFPQ